MPGVIVIAGRTFEVRDRLKQLGAQWDPERRAWVVARAGMSRRPLSDDAPRAARIEEEIRKGSLPGCRLEWRR